MRSIVAARGWRRAPAMPGLAREPGQWARGPGGGPVGHPGGMPDHALAPEPPPAPRNPSGSYRVSLVCLGNICRSPTAEVVLREELAQASLGGKVEVDSSGTGNWHVGGPMDSGARAELAARGYDGSAHRARQFDRSWFGAYDLVIAMDRRNLADLRRMAPDQATAR